MSDVFVSVYNDQQHFVHRNAEGIIKDAWYGRDGWHLQQINVGGDGGQVPANLAGFVMTGGPAAVGDLFVSVYNDQQHFTYRDARQNLQDAWYGSDGWHLQQINNANGAGAPGPLPDEYIAGNHTKPKATAAAVGGLFVSVYNDQQHFTYLDAKGGIQDVSYGTDGWHLQQINEAFGPAVPGESSVTNGPGAMGGLFVSVYNDQQHFSYLAAAIAGFAPTPTSFLIQDAWYGTDGWHLQQINGIDPTVPGEFVTPFDAPAAVGDLFVSVYNDQQHFTYQDLFGNIQDAWYGTDGWDRHLQQIKVKGINL